MLKCCQVKGVLRGKKSMWWNPNHKMKDSLWDKGYQTEREEKRLQYKKSFAIRLWIGL